MPNCATCNADYDKTFTVEYNGDHYIFDCFECAIHKLAPSCARCGCKIIGHGVEDRGQFYCCQHCKMNAGKVQHAERATHS